MSLFFLILLAITIKVMCGAINIVCRERERERIKCMHIKMNQ